VALPDPADASRHSHEHEGAGRPAPSCLFPAAADEVILGRDLR
jgi:hypothetical protein